MQLKFDWPEKMSGQVTSVHGRKSQHFLADSVAIESRVRYSFVADKQGDGGLLLAKDDIELVGGGAGLAGHHSDIALGMASQLANIVVTTEGEFLGAFVPPAKKESALEPLTPLDRLLQSVSSADAVSANASTHWQHMVAGWIGQTLAPGATYRGEGRAVHPLIPNATVRVQASFSVVGYVPCVSLAYSLDCVELQAVYERRLDDVHEVLRELAAKMPDAQQAQQLQQLRFNEYSEAISLVTDPLTLQPYRYEYQLTSDLTSKDGRRDSTLTYQVNEFSYP